MNQQQIEQVRERVLDRARQALGRRAADASRAELQEALHRAAAALDVAPGHDRGLVVMWGLAQHGCGS